MKKLKTYALLIALSISFTLSPVFADNASDMVNSAIQTKIQSAYNLNIKNNGTGIDLVSTYGQIGDMYINKDQSYKNALIYYKKAYEAGMKTLSQGNKADITKDFLEQFNKYAILYANGIPLSEDTSKNTSEDTDVQKYQEAVNILRDVKQKIKLTGLDTLKEETYLDAALAMNSIVIDPKEGIEFYKKACTTFANNPQLTMDGDEISDIYLEFQSNYMTIIGSVEGANIDDLAQSYERNVISKYGAGTMKDAMAKNSISMVYFLKRDYSKALAYAKSAYDIAKKYYADTDTYMYYYQINLANIYYFSKDYANAKIYYQKAYINAKSTFGENDSKTEYVKNLLNSIK